MIPSAGQEAARRLMWARDDVRSDVMRSRHRLSKLLLRQRILYEDTAWTGAHDRWLRSQSFEKPGVQRSRSTRLRHDVGRLDRFDNTILTVEPAWASVVTRLGCLCGVGTLTGFRLPVNIGDWHRFTGNSIGSFFRLPPSEHSSGGSKPRPD
jgi:transposase